MSNTNHPASNGSHWNGEMPRVRRVALYLRAGMTCEACGRSAMSRRLRLSLDHLRAVSLGGSNADGNLVMLCLSCNCSKGKLSLKAWLSKGGHSRRGLAAPAVVVERALRAQAARPLANYRAAAEQVVKAENRRRYQREKASRAA